MRKIFLGVFSFLALCFLILTGNSAASTFTVTNTNDSGAGSLRQAILNANVNLEPDRIEFNIPACGTVCTIRLLNDLPTLSENGTTIDGYTQPGAVPATYLTSAILKIEIDGSDIVDNNCLNIVSANNAIYGLIINRFPVNGIAIAGPAATDNTIAGNYIGTDATGNVDQGNGLDGISISLGARANLIGGPRPQFRNVISANGWEGVGIHGIGTDENVVAGNYIGVNATGTTALGNKLYGVRIYGGAKNNQLLGYSRTTTSLISGNVLDGIRIWGAETSQNQVGGNAIGTDRTLNNAIPNGRSGLFIGAGAHHNYIGGETEPLESNIISGNENGIIIDGSGTEQARYNAIDSNLIGLGMDLSLPSFISALGNTGYGILIQDGAHHNGIGRNCIVANKYGIGLGNPAGSGSPVSYNLIGENIIGLDPRGENLGNLSTGIILYSGSQANYIGSTIHEPNFISGNVDYGIQFAGSDILGNIIANNRIGLNEDGEPQPNGSMGILVEGNNIRNNIFSLLTIAHHSSSAIELRGGPVYGNVITRNSVYSNGEGINLLDGANGGIAKPVISSFSRTGTGAYLIHGLACPGCTVELFSNRTNDPEGEIYLETTIAAADGTFSFWVTSLSYLYLTATATDPLNGTSEFSDLFIIHWTYLPLILKN